MLSKIRLLFDTVRHLKPTQIYHQLYYRLRKPKPLVAYYQSDMTVQLEKLSFTFELSNESIVHSHGNFCFLNVLHNFTNGVDWNYQGNGKLWNYNLQYFNFLHQRDLSDESKVDLLHDILLWLKDGRLPLEPYPVSLRVMNTMRYYSVQDIDDSKILDDLVAQLNYLQGNLEYHLLGNHLLENAFALMMGGIAFIRKDWQETAKEILVDEMNEQILDDGAHFELSPMYHQIILFRVLELIDYYGSSSDLDADFLKFMKGKATAMLAWLKSMTFSNGDIPHLNDSADEIAFRSDDLFSFAEALGFIEPIPTLLRGSGYRKFETTDYECIIDVGAVGPSYQPGHSHADALSFILYAHNTPFLVEAGTSTYQIGKRRNYERSTSAHNTVVIGNKNQSEVWGGFRVGKRAQVRILSENGACMTAEHDGYKRSFNILHKRSFVFNSSNIEIEDEVGNVSGQFFLHFHPKCQVNLVNTNTLSIKGISNIYFKGANSIEISDYDFATGFNSYASGKRIIVDFKKKLHTSINLIK